MIREWHGLIHKGIDDAHAGVWRTVNVEIVGATHRPPDALEVPALMDALIEGGRDRRDERRHPIERATWSRSELVRVHPFVDGNGRAARLLMNLEALAAGDPPILIRVEDRLRYYEALDRAHTTGESDAILALTSERAIDSLRRYLDLL